jgi:putative lipoprotein
MQTLSGEVFYRERKLLPPGAELRVTLEDVSKMDVPSTIIGTSTQLLTGAPPYKFSLDYPASDIEMRMIQLNMVGSAKTEPQAAPTHDADTGLAVVSVNPLAELTNTYWKLLSLNEADIVMAEEQTREAFLQLRDDTKSVKGFAGCNAFTGSYTVNGNDLDFGPLAATRKACPAGMNTETEFLQVLDGVAYYSIHEEALTLLNEQKKPVARFVAVYFN